MPVGPDRWCGSRKCSPFGIARMVSQSPTGPRFRCRLSPVGNRLGDSPAPKRKRPRCRGNDRQCKVLLAQGSLQPDIGRFNPTASNVRFPRGTRTFLPVRPPTESSESCFFEGNWTLTIAGMFPPCERALTRINNHGRHQWGHWYSPLTRAVFTTDSMMIRDQWLYGSSRAAAKTQEAAKPLLVATNTPAMASAAPFTRSNKRPWPPVRHNPAHGRRFRGESRRGVAVCRKVSEPIPKPWPPLPFSARGRHFCRFGAVSNS